MKNPQVLTVVDTHTYGIPTFRVTDTGMEDGEEVLLKFCRGNKEDDSIPRQDGMFTESVIKAAKTYLETVNVGPMATRETSMVITKLDEALMWIEKRAKDRELRGVQGTYKS